MQIKTPATMLRDGSMFIYGQDDQPAMNADELVRVLAHQLSQIRRYCGAVGRPISVAAHCLLALRVAGKTPTDTPHRRLESVLRDLAVLLHDRAEIVTADIPGPFLRHWRETDNDSYDTIYVATKRRFDDASIRMLGIAPRSFDRFEKIVSYADVQALLMEANAWMPKSEHYTFDKVNYDSERIDVDEYFAMTADGSDAAIFTRTLETLLEEYRTAITYLDGLPIPEKAAPEKMRANYIPMENMYLLHMAAAEVGRAYAAHDNFGCYLVGSSTERPDFRDVDVRCIMHDAAFEALFPKNHETGLRPLWMLTCMSLSQWFKHVTKLPVDFQFQKQSVANARHDGRRDGLGRYHFKGDAT